MLRCRCSESAILSHQEIPLKIAYLVAERLNCPYERQVIWIVTCTCLFAANAEHVINWLEASVDFPKLRSKFHSQSINQLVAICTARYTMRGENSWPENWDGSSC